MNAVKDKNKELKAMGFGIFEVLDKHLSVEPIEAQYQNRKDRKALIAR